ncbi:hypothetical protein AB0L49_43005 [Streptomyces antimycoticus]|uniref:hypothetical protein n=1 Tax=Streptomyces antimycoticus TaxID=68175 RepID=UPI00343A369A
MSTQTSREDNRQWASLGLLFGGDSHEARSANGTFGPIPDKELPLRWDPGAQVDSVLWELRQAGLDRMRIIPARRTAHGGLPVADAALL